MNVNIETNATEYDPGDIIQFCGGVASLLPTSKDKQKEQAFQPAQTTVVVSLVDEEGVVLAAAVVQANSDGVYSGRLVAPPETRGKIFLIAEAAMDNTVAMMNACGWYGLAEKVLVFPLKVAPQVSLATTTTTNGATNGHRKTAVHINAQVTDPDSGSEIELIHVVISDGSGQMIKRWQANDFDARNGIWKLTSRNQLSGVAPWSVTLTAEDSVGNVATTSQLIQLAD